MSSQSNKVAQLEVIKNDHDQYEGKTLEVYSGCYGDIVALEPYLDTQ